MGKKLIAGLVVVFLFILTYWGMYKKSGDIQTDLTGQVKKAFNRADVKVDSLAVSGRDAVLRGSIATQELKDKALETAKNVYGIRKVDDELTIEKPDLAENTTHLESTLAEMHESVSSNIRATDAEINEDAKDIAGQAAVSAKNELQTDPLKRHVVSEVPVQARIAADQSVRKNPDRTKSNDPVHENAEHQISEVLAGGRVTFEQNSAIITPVSRDILRDLAPVMKRHNPISIEIAGHTDATGNHALNLELSQRRADSVKEFLVQNGVDASQLKSVGYGENRPVSNNMTDYGRQQNRRVEFLINLGEKK